ncbi:MAG TPA: hydroxyacid dehydrogenase, partial [Candidatus Aerophobetes bacterium]|nr:hydroxyacid dehydrogenase [Candidatus Aerophobetes bacterium]
MMNLAKIRKEDLFESFPSPWKTDLFEEIKAIVKAMKRKVVVIDDDPTGVQTVHD